MTASKACWLPWMSETMATRMKGSSVGSRGPETSAPLALARGRRRGGRGRRRVAATPVRRHRAGRSQRHIVFQREGDRAGTRLQAPEPGAVRGLGGRRRRRPGAARPAPAGGPDRHRAPARAGRRGRRGAHRRPDGGRAPDRGRAAPALAARGPRDSVLAWLGGRPAQGAGHRRRPVGRGRGALRRARPPAPAGLVGARRGGVGGPVGWVPVRRPGAARPHLQHLHPAARGPHARQRARPGREARA